MNAPSRIGHHLIGEAYEVRVFYRCALSAAEPGWFWRRENYFYVSEPAGRGPFNTSEDAYRHALQILG